MDDDTTYISTDTSRDDINNSTLQYNFIIYSISLFYPILYILIICSFAYFEQHDYPDKIHG
jgi:hypothetical protein